MHNRKPNVIIHAKVLHGVQVVGINEQDTFVQPLTRDGTRVGDLRGKP